VSTQAVEKIELVYDDQCPVCRTYCQNIKVDDGISLSLVDARKDGPLMEEITKKGLDIDQGMVLKTGDTLYYGSDAMRQISLRAQKKGWLALINRLFFTRQSHADIFYPLGRSLRNGLLRLLGIEDIQNLKPKNILKHQLGEQWQRLDPNVQERFDNEPEADSPK